MLFLISMISLGETHKSRSLFCSQEMENVRFYCLHVNLYFCIFYISLSFCVKRNKLRLQQSSIAQYQYQFIIIMFCFILSVKQKKTRKCLIFKLPWPVHFTRLVYTIQQASKLHVIVLCFELVIWCGNLLLTFKTDNSYFIKKTMRIVLEKARGKKKQRGQRAKSVPSINQQSTRTMNQTKMYRATSVYCPDK